MTNTPDIYNTTEPIDALYALVLIKPPSTSYRLRRDEQRPYPPNEPMLVRDDSDTLAGTCWTEQFHSVNEGPLAKNQVPVSRFEGHFTSQMSLSGSGTDSSTRMVYTLPGNYMNHVPDDDFNCFTSASVSPNIGNSAETLLIVNGKGRQAKEERSHPTLSFRIRPKPSYTCTHRGCNTQFTRIYDLHRHCRSRHAGEAKFPCRDAECERANRKFPRKDKRDEHERNIHGRFRASLNVQ